MRAQRRSWELTQDELGSLVLNGTRGHVSRVERGIASPNAREILAYPLVFGVYAPDLFPLFFAEVANAIIEGTDQLQRTLESQATPKSVRKCNFVGEARARVLSALAQSNHERNA